jgi:hypothetical protein
LSLKADCSWQSAFFCARLLFVAKKSLVVVVVLAPQDDEDVVSLPHKQKHPNRKGPGALNRS